MIQDSKDFERLLKYDNLIQLWKEFCGAHTTLYDLTCEEYLKLLESDIESLEGILKRKETVLERINKLEQKRLTTIDEINQKNLFGLHISKVSELIEALSVIEQERNGKHLQKFNLLLVDIIEKIQEQNKKNQIFLNRAMINLKDMKESFSGKKKYKTYSSIGVAK